MRIRKTYFYFFLLLLEINKSNKKRESKLKNKRLRTFCILSLIFNFKTTTSSSSSRSRNDKKKRNVRGSINELLWLFVYLIITFQNKTKEDSKQWIRYSKSKRLKERIIWDPHMPK